jgi:ferredoxin
MTITIEQDRENCIGCGACAAVCPDNWEMTKEGKSKPKKTSLKEIGCNMEAAESCPVNVIHISEDGKKKI